jgi:hypothetical protein
MSRATLRPWPWALTKLPPPCRPNLRSAVCPSSWVRNSSRGLFWLETLVEVQTPQGRVAYGPVAPEDVPGLLDAGLLSGSAHALCHGLTEQIPYLARQERLTFARMGITDPLSLADYEAHGGWAGLRAALAKDGAAVVDEVLQSGLRGRGGCRIPGRHQVEDCACRQGGPEVRGLQCDEGDSGTYSDRMTMEGDPFMLIEGMTIAALAVGATQGYVYIRSEYPHAIAVMNEAIARAEAAGYLGANVCASGQAFHLHVRKAAGSYVCARRKPPCWRASKASAALSVPSRPCRLLRACLDSPRSSTTSSPLPRYPSSWPRGRRSTRAMAWAALPARCRSSWRATSSRVAWLKKPLA